MRRLFLVGFALTLGVTARADVKPHPLFTDHMVLQRGIEIPVWGKAEPGEKVKVTLGKSDASATADDKGMWAVKLPKAEAATGLTLSIHGKNEIELKDVAVGEVWVCSGQSNMEWKVKQLTNEGQSKKVSSAAKNANIRLFTVPNRPSAKPEYDFPVSKIEGKWLECNAENVTEFSAVGYFFGRDIQKALNVPVGLIASDWGGTSCQSWTSREALSAKPELKYYVDQHDATMKNYDPDKAEAAYKKSLENWKVAAEKAKADGKPAPQQPRKAGNPSSSPTTTTLYNGMIAPIQHFAIKGAIWYQGESNAGKAAEYYTLYPAMIADWRKQWGYDFPFIGVQLAPFRGGSSGVDYAELRDSQFHATKVLKHVGIAIITDAGDETDIHPQQKEPVGVRLALSARALAYGQKVEYSGPVYKNVKVDGDNLILSFDHVGGGLVSNGETLTGFTVCGDDKVFKPAKAKIVGETIVVTSGDIAKPIAVRYGWVNFAKPTLNFGNKAGLPAVPFRTDDFPLTTAPTPKPAPMPALKKS